MNNISSYAPARAALLLAFVLGIVLTESGCSVRKYAINSASDALAGSGNSFAQDNDPELIRDAAPFSLKAMESMLAENPNHIGLLTATARGFTQYTYVFVQQDGEELEDKDIKAATVRFDRARLLYARARDYGLRGLEVTHPGIGTQLRQNPRAAVAQTKRDDVPLLYWTAASWGSLISLSKDDPKTVAEVPMTEALIDRALELNEAWDAGAIHTFLISYELVRQGQKGDPVARSQLQFERAVQLSDGQLAAPYVVMAESVAVSRQDRKQFESLLKQALAIDVNARPDWRLSNIVMQQRARWLLSRTDELIAQ
jgi:predicted anti-sigma-YlaC factor YlaD